MKNPILITGIPRSGTSMIAGIINICGGFMGDVNRMYENKEIKEKVINPFMNSINSDPTGQINHPDLENISIPLNFGNKVTNIIQKQGCDENQKWAVKSNVISLMYPVWNYAFPDAKYIIVRRRTGDIVNSCMKTAYMSAYSDKEGWIEMCRSYQIYFAQMIEQGLNCKVIWPHRMAYGDYSQIWEMLEWLGLEWNTKILNWVDPKFLKIRKK